MTGPTISVTQAELRRFTDPVSPPPFGAFQWRVEDEATASFVAALLGPPVVRVTGTERKAGWISSIEADRRFRQDRDIHLHFRTDADAVEFKLRYAELFEE